MTVDPTQLDSLLHPQFDAAALKNTKPIAKGLPASPGAASGQIVFSADDVIKWVGRGKRVILVRLETSPEDIEGMHHCGGHPYRAGRHDQPRGGGGPGHGRLLRIRLRR